MSVRLASWFSPLAITGVGAITAVGDQVDQVCASVRAGLMGFTEHAFYRPIPSAPLPDEDGDEAPALLAAPVGDLDPLLDGRERLLELAARAFADLAQNAEVDAVFLRESALLVSLPALDPVVETWDLAKDFVPAFCRRTRLPFKDVVVVQAGPTGMIELLGEASRLLARGAAARCVLLGADSYLTADRLEMLDASYRIKSRRNVDGFIPGEAAAAVLLETPERAAARETRADGIVSSVGLGSEPETFRSDKQSSGAGLTEALRALFANEGGEAAELVLCDLNGESYRAIEWGLVLVRLGDELAGVRKLVHPANCHGDIGAATAGVLMAIASASFRRYAPSGEATLFCGGDGPTRAAARLRKP